MEKLEVESILEVIGSLQLKWFGNLRKWKRGNRKGYGKEEWEKVRAGEIKKSVEWGSGDNLLEKGNKNVTKDKRDEANLCTDHD